MDIEKMKEETSQWGSEQRGLKQQMRELEQQMEQKANKASVKDALHWKANKVDVEGCLREFISVSRI